MRNKLTAALLLIFTLGVVTSCVSQTSLESPTVVETPTETSLDETTSEEEHLGQSEPVNTSEEPVTSQETDTFTEVESPLAPPWTQFDLDNELYTLKDICVQLSKWEMTWQETFNVSTERMDLVCADGTKLIFLNKWSDVYGSGFDQGMILIMIDNSFCTRGFQESYLKKVGDQSALEYYPQTAEYIILESELMKMSQTDLSIARNEIYARHGRMFSDPFLNAVFSLKTWYQPQYTGMQFAKMEEGLLTDIEKENLMTIVKVEEALRYRIRAGETYRIPQMVRNFYTEDFDLDGIPEGILFIFNFDGPTSFAKDYYFVINPKQRSESVTNVAVSALPYLYTVNLDNKTTQLLVTETQDKKPAGTAIYYYKEGQLHLAGRINAFNLEIYDDCFYAYRYIDQDHELTERVRFVYENNAIYEK